MKTIARRAAVLALAAAWASAGAAPFMEALTGAPAPIDFVRDYVAAHAHVHGAATELAAPGAGDAYGVAIGVPRVVLLEAPYYVHPPTAQLFVLPLVAADFRGAARAWLVLSLAALGALAVSLVGIATRQARPPVAAVAATYLALALWPPVLHNLAKGQWSIFLAALLAAGWRALDGGRPRAAGAYLGLAACLKAMPLLMFGYLFLRHRRAAWTMALTLAALGLTSLAVFGVQPWQAWLANARPNVQAWQTWIANTASINGLVARLFTASAFARPIVAAPLVAQALTLATTALLVGMALIATRRAAPDPALATRRDRALYAVWLAIVVVSNPLAWTHNTIIALVPLALLLGLAPPWPLAVALVTLTVPRQTLAVLAGPLPVSPARGLVLAAHALALLAVIATALRAARDEARAPAAPAGPPVR